MAQRRRRRITTAAATNRNTDRTRAFIGNSSSASLLSLTLGPVTRESNGDVTVTVGSNAQPVAGSGFFTTLSPIVGLVDTTTLPALEDTKMKKQVSISQSGSATVTFTGSPQRTAAVATFPSWRSDDPPVSEASSFPFSNDPNPKQLLRVRVPPLSDAVSVTVDGVTLTQCNVPDGTIRPGESTPVSFTVSSDFPLRIKTTVEATASKAGVVARDQTTVTVPPEGSTEGQIDFTPPEQPAKYPVSIRAVSASKP